MIAQGCLMYHLASTHLYCEPPKFRLLQSYIMTLKIWENMLYWCTVRLGGAHVVGWQATQKLNFNISIR